MEKVGWGRVGGINRDIHVFRLQAVGPLTGDWLGERGPGVFRTALL